MNSKRWQDQFTEEYKNLEQSPSAEDGISHPLFYALTHHFLNEDAYLAWAKESFGLPVLKKSYFENALLEETLWSSVQSAHTWSPECLPLLQWEGHLYVACLEPQNFSPGLNAIPILCPTNGLKQLWQKYHGQGSSAEESLEAISFEDSLSGIEIPSENSTNTEAIAEESLEGIFENTAPVSLKFEPFELAPSQMPEATAEATSDSGQAELTELKVPPPAAIPKQPLNARSENLESDTKGEISFVNSDLIPEPVSKVTQTSIPSKPTNPVMTPTVVGLASTGLDNYFLGKIQGNEPSVFEKECSVLFTELKKYFHKSILLGADYNLKTVKVIAWDESTRENPGAMPIDLRGPSIFHLSETTQKPFHGPISPSEINDRFFSDWNRKEVPENVTLVPYIYNDKVIAMVLSFGDAQSYSRATLQTAERIAFSFFQRLVPAKIEAA